MNENESTSASPDADCTSKVKPWASFTIVVSICAVMGLTWFGSGPRLFENFAKIDQRIFAGEWWRLFTAGFLHVNLVHLGVNIISLLSIGPIVERWFGAARFLAVFLVGSAAGFLASALLVPAPSVGASAGVFVSMIIEARAGVIT
jgi:rhomboid protease GluP